MSDTHLHLMLDATFENTPTAKDIKFVENWCLRLVKKLDMEVFFPPIAKYDDTIGNEGLSFIGMLTTSHFSGHFWKNFGKFDCYSCRTYKVQDFLDMFQEFDPKEMKYMLIDRSNSNFEIVDSGTIKDKHSIDSYRAYLK